MALGIYEEEDIRAIAENIRHYAGGGSSMTVREMSGEIVRVHSAGMSDGYSEGYNACTSDMQDDIKEAREDGFTHGYSQGYTIGESLGRESGYNEGYTEGKTDGIAEGVEQGKTEANAVFENANSDLENILYGEQRGYPVQNNMSQAKFDLYEIGEAIRESGVTPSKTTEGYAENIGEIYGAGRKSQYDEFWDVYQDYGKRSSYENAFAGNGWTAETIKPKYAITVDFNANQMFYANKNKLDIVEVFEKVGWQIDFRKAYAHSALCGYSNFIRVGVIDLTNGNVNAYSLFLECVYLKTIEKLIIPDKAFTFNSWFNNCAALENLTIEGVIANSGFNVQYSPKLSKASITSIINALSTTTSGLTVTISKTAVNNAFNGGSTGDEWLNLVATKNNWTISLV